MHRHLVVVAAAVLALLLAPKSGRATPSRAGAAGDVLLQRVDELRRIDLVEQEDDGFQMNAPGLVLTFGFDQPEGRRVVELHEPASVRAVDSTGRDLTAIDENFFGRREHVELLQVWGESPRTFTFKLALPQRQAASFDLETTVEMVTDTGSREAIVEVGDVWAPLDPDLLPGEPVTARLVQGPQDMQLELRPGTVRAAIESAKILGGAEPIDSYSTMWNDAAVTYYFQGRLQDDMKVKLALRTDLMQTHVTIALDDQRLP